MEPLYIDEHSREVDVAQTVGVPAEDMREGNIQLGPLQAYKREAPDKNGSRDLHLLEHDG